MAHWNRIVAAGLAFIALGASVSAVDLQQVLFVGNNWEGTASILQSTYPFASLGKVNVVPDKAERIAAINANPIAWIYYQIIQGQVGEGHDQLVDDLYATPDGTALVASRPSFADVVSIDLKTGKVNWRFAVAGNRADHMAVSPDGLRVAVSASTANTVHVLDINTGKELGNFKTGDNAHENFFTNGATLIWNMAIGHVETALDDPIWDWTKGDRHITIADANTFEIVKTINMRDRLTAFGLGTNYSNAIRPAAFLPDYSKLYFQVSFFNGFFEYDVAADKLLRKATLPTDLNLTPDRSKWLLDSRHHGITMHPTGTKVCVAGTMDSYATIVDLATLSPKNLVPATKPYWATISGDGKHCVVSEAGANITSFIDFETGVKVAQTQVGYHPQRVRLARIPVDWKSLL
ncbi:putative serine/threonine protein kinase [Gonapodya prolifera JEL478]|uniref:Putative serine/threonine protein kinase n=1 Tax=Gonapodya prolifera (strain JEL478) TaxID=1344416 RepID=A0A138ZZU8_GONPJ|nr:putative serine/threonine protein kinase [Gonapodya prolifera JEL478]|eukprot:KXS09938.1 putative serine/threonine protein kinase [Gonapodya prolifera JEL478]